VHQSAVQRALSAALGTLPRVSGADLRVARELGEALDLAAKEAADLKDKFVSTEHLLLALVSDAARRKDVRAARVLHELGANRDLLLSALRDVRGSQTADTEDPEGTYEALAKYARDLTALAKQEKLDPVIGRDAEIRR